MPSFRPVREDTLSTAVLAPGSVALIGGGPGALDLITVRGLALLQQADVVVVDRLGPTALTAQLAADVEVIDVGKRPGAHSLRQSGIEELLVRRALAGQRVVRLKGGDPFVLGRGGEEVLACRAAGVPVQVVPGVTSAIAGPAAGDVPVTHRGAAVALHIVNAHGDLGPADLAALRDPGTTTVLMMGVEWLPRLVSQSLLNGIEPSTPVAIVQSATTAEQQVVHGTLATIEQIAGEAGISHPAVITVGRTAAARFLHPPLPAAPGRGSGREALPARAPEAAAGEPSPAAGAPELTAGQPSPAAPAVPVLIGCSHGTRSRAGRDVVRALLAQIAQRAPGAVREAFVDVQSPDVREVVGMHAQPVETRTREAGEVQAVVVPLLLSLGHHVRSDIGGAVGGRAAVAAPPLGPDPRLVEVLTQRLQEAGLEPSDAVVLAGSGTRDPEGAAQVRQMARLLGERLGREVTVGVVPAGLAAAGPSLAEAVALARERQRGDGLPAGRVAVASYLLAPGHFHDLVCAAGADVASAPLGAHPLLVDIVMERYQAALGG